MFKFNSKKSIETILWIIQHDPSPNLYRTLKIIYAADKFHLNNYGRPVTGDRYVALRHGTVPSAIYDMLKNNDPLSLQSLKLDNYPFELAVHHSLKAGRTPKLGEFSESDIEALEFGLNEYAAMSFSEIEKKNHLEPGWQKVWEEKPNGTIDFSLIVEDENLLAEIKENSSHIVI